MGYARNFKPQRMEDIIQKRKAIEAENRKLRTDLSHSKAQIKDYERRIEAIKFVMKKTQQTIANNNDTFFELGKKNAT